MTSSSPGKSSSSRRLSVLQSFPTPRTTTNPFLSQLVDALPEDVTTTCFSWHAALFGDYQVFHVHWPEHLIRDQNPMRRYARRVLFALLLVRLRAARIALVRTVHNESPHEAMAYTDRRLLRSSDSLTAVWIRLNPRTVVPRPDQSVTIPHGHYRAWFSDHVVPDAVPGRLLFFGLIRPYKGVSRLLEAFSEIEDPSATLQVVGQIVPHPSAAKLLADIDGARDTDERISARLEYVADSELATAIGQAELIVLPYADMHNSGAALLALSLGRPLLVPRSVVTEDLAAEVGPGWVILYEGELNAADLGRALRQVRHEARRATPDLSRREWAQIGLRHRDAYDAALGLARSPR